MKEILDTDFGDKVAVSTIPVDSSDGKPKVYKIDINGEAFFDWKDGAVVAAPPAKTEDEEWKTPVNFETHEKYFGPHKAWQVEQVKEAVAAKIAA